MSDAAAAFQLADKSYLVPPCTDENFIPGMLTLCQEEGVDLVVPTIDTELATYSSHRESFARAGTMVAVSSPETIAIASDKRRTHDFLTSHDLPTVRQACVSDVLAAPGDWPWPLLLKPAQGSAGKGIHIADGVGNLKLLQDEGDHIAQTIAPGVEYTVDVLADGQGRTCSAVARRRIEVRGGEVSKAVTVRHADVIRTARAVVDELPGAFGVLTVQIFHDAKTGNLAVIEINARFGGGFPLSYRAGADYPGWLIQAAQGNEPETFEDRWDEGLVMLRFDDAVFVSLDELQTEV